MAKNGGKKAAQQETNQAQEAAAEEESKTAQKVFMNNISDKMIRDAKGKDGKDYKSVSFVYGKDEDGKDIMGSVLVKPGQILDSTKAGKGDTRVDNPGFKNVLLGTEGQHYNVSLNQKDADGNYMNAKMTTVEIKQANEEARKAYKEAQKQKDANAKAADAADLVAEGAEATADLEAGQ